MILVFLLIVILAAYVINNIKVITEPTIKLLEVNDDKCDPGDPSKAWRHKWVQKIIQEPGRHYLKCAKCGQEPNVIE